MMERHQSTTTYLAGTGFQHTRLLMQGDQRRTVMRTATAAPFVEIRSSEDWLEGDALGATVQGFKLLLLDRFWRWMAPNKEF